MRRHQSGFSIIELMIVLTVAGIILAFGVPSFNYQVKNSQLTSGVNQLVAAMHLSRSEASKRKVPVVLCTSTTALEAGSESCSTSASWSDGWLVFADVNNTGLYDSGDVLLQSQDRQNGKLEIQSAPEIEHSIVYLPSGFAQLPINTTSGRYIVYCNADHEDRYSRVLAFSNSGRPQVVSRDNVSSGAPSCTSGG